MPAPRRYAAPMLAAYIWHWWIGVLLLLGLVVAMVVLIGAFLKFVTAQQYPGKRQRRDD